MKKYSYLYSKESQKFSTVQSITCTYLSQVMIDNGRKRGSYDSTEWRLSILSRYFTKNISDITGDDVYGYTEWRLKTVSGSTVRLDLQLLSRVFKWCHKNGIVDEIPVKDIEYPKSGKPRDRIINEFSFRLILSNTTEIMKPIFILGYETAMRRSEILALRPSMIDLKSRVIHLDDTMTKNGNSRNVPLSTTAVNLLRGLIEFHQTNDLIFNLKPHSVTRAFKRACQKSHIENICFHTLRHTCITRYAEKDLNILALQCISGHRDIRMLARYSHIRAEKVALMMD
ncbi:tyrosine-type recombinase/integrase [Lelliottia wanjuensis]|uniref:Site-specific integrase n=1 Tax=Lelliottia wanjuensis TaxID=3050585 RepID=A0AAP4LDI1_9ENTR|nr:MULTISPECIES: site-specific integrase [unclassified Lelliottia]MDK9366434.1 site-specific integrase [Lelliottia sp. V106_12]MDK9618697.1 site-specific integrase [Lelliottia sp. V106_9]